ncbi:MAG: hypothetical protein PUB51_05255 [Oscillospiraceae bacterium]|nr:hypothetical protein [Oscillospiraceae bacterium]
MELLIATPAGCALPSKPAGLIPVRMAYRLGPGPSLLALPMEEGSGGGLMLLDRGEGGEFADPLPCCRQITAECRRRDYRGVLCDFDRPPDPGTGQFLSLLAEHCGKEGLSLLLPESCAPFAPEAQVLIPSPVTSGSLERRVRNALQRYGANRAVLAVQWLREDLTLPMSGRGKPLTAQALETQMRQLQPATFFDRGLCTNYYTYMTPGGQAHFVLFDTPRSIRAKLALARRLELSAVLLALPEVGGHWGDIFNEQ